MNDDSGAVLIPLRGRGGEVVAQAVVDAENAWVAKWRWYRTNAGYAARSVRQPGQSSRTILMHRVVMGVGDIRGRRFVVDHINGNRLDNRRCNLRLCSHAQNIGNSRRQPNSTGYRCVYRYGRVYRAEVGSHHTRVRRYFRTAEDAYAWVEQIRRERGYIPEVA